MSEKDQQFDTFDQWVARASTWLTRHPRYDGKTFRVQCVDTKGRICSIGKDFMRARDEGAFPIRWTWPDQRPTKSVPADLEAAAEAYVDSRDLLFGTRSIAKQAYIDAYQAGCRHGWMRACVYHNNYMAESDPDEIANINQRWPL